MLFSVQFVHVCINMYVCQFVYKLIKLLIRTLCNVLCIVLWWTTSHYTLVTFNLNCWPGELFSYFLKSSHCLYVHFLTYIKLRQTSSRVIHQNMYCVTWPINRGQKQPHIRIHDSNKLPYHYTTFTEPSDNEGQITHGGPKNKPTFICSLCSHIRRSTKQETCQWSLFFNDMRALELRCVYILYLITAAI